MLPLLLMLACGDKEEDSAVEPAIEETQEVEDTAAEPEIEDTAESEE